jgi:hypothetical protein
MRIRIHTLAAGPRGIMTGGSEHDVPEAEARAMIEGGFASALEVADAQPATEAAVVRPAAEVADAAPAAEIRKKGGKRASTANR